MQKFCLIFLFLLLLNGCNPSAAPISSKVSSSAASTPTQVESHPSDPIAFPAGREPFALENASIEQAADDLLTDLLHPDMQPEEQIRTVYRYLVETVWFADPVGLDQWRYRSDPNSPPPYLENRALSPLFFQVGSCEDFAAALTVLLHRMGLRAYYVSGLTISVEGTFVDHAWVIVQLEGNWYHLDPQLEQNIVRNNTLTYRYYLKDDQTMLADHRWGDSLAAYWGEALSQEQKELLRTEMTPPDCPSCWETPPDPEQIQLPAKPNSEQLLQTIQQEKTAWEAKNGGPLPPVSLHIVPPIYAFLPLPEIHPQLPDPSFLQYNTAPSKIP